MTVEINGQIFKILIESSEISRKVSELGKYITQDYQDKDLVIIGILKGGLIFLADLIRHIETKVEIDFIRVSSYKDSMKPGALEVIYDINAKLKGRDVLLVEDLIDTGATLDFIKKKITAMAPASLRICTLIKKNKASQIKIDIDYIGFEIEDEFIVGYGTDFAEEGRNLADIYVIEH